MFNYNTNFSSKSKDLTEHSFDVFSIYKQAGETLASLILRFRKENFLSNEIPITYAGRLDPMAEGLVLLLTGDKCKEKDIYLGLDKTYVFEVLFGISTDTFDMLGLVSNSLVFNPSKNQINEIIEKIKNTKEFTYPPYSSKTVKGKPLFTYAKEGNLPKDMPTIKAQIKSLELKNIRTESLEDILQNSFKIIKEVKGDFRQEQIIKSWESFLQKNKNKKYIIGTFEANVSSGTYIRTLATILGGLAYSIKRTKIEEFEL